MHKFLSERAAELARLVATVRSGLEEAKAIIPPLNDQLSELAMLGVAHYQVEGPSVYARPAGLSNDTDDAIVVFQAVLLMPGGIGAATWSELIASLIGRMEESRQEYVTSEALAPTVGAMFLWWRDNCARHAPEHIEADVLVRGNVADAVVDELAQLVWSLRRLEKRMEQE